MNEKYIIKFDEVAQKQLNKVEKSGQQIYLKKIFSFLNELKTNPRIGSGKPEQLKHQKQGEETWSRKINKKDRLVYHISEKENKILIIQVLGHYQDK